MLWKKLRGIWTCFWLACVLVGATAAAQAGALRDSVALLIPDGTNPNQGLVQAWVDAAREEGYQLDIVTDSQLLAPSSPVLGYAGIIAPDSVHFTASDEVVTALHSYVTSGGKLMLVYDFGALTATGFFPIPGSRFSDIVGVNYVLYDQLRDRTIGLGPLTLTSSRMWDLQIPPGKSLPYVPSGATEPPPAADPVMAISGYVYGYLRYPAFVTQGTYSGDTIMASPDFGLVAGYKDSGTGGVLFVNTPLAYLKGQTDGMLMHGFLRYFAGTLLGMPRLSNVPAGQGGMVFNWHFDWQEVLDVGGGVNPTQILSDAGIWDKGPFSIHLTAGPDVAVFGDGLGMNLPANAPMQSWVATFDQKGHQVSSHGGWIHDYWGANASEDNQSTFQQYLELNKSAVDSALGHAGIEYSSPEGNTPKWVLTWLEQQGVSSYYFMGHTGMPATRAYREGQLLNQNIWAVPVNPFGRYATFEEFDQFGVTTADVTAWYHSLVDFNVANHTNRMIYAHPPGAYTHTDILLDLFNYAQSKGAGFRWYTMADLAQFGQTRRNVQWSSTEQSGSSVAFNASIPLPTGNLNGETWLLPKATFNEPSITSGTGTVITTDAADWVVSATGGTSFQFAATRR